MAKDKIQYVCTACGCDSPKWIGKCPSCGEWNTFVEQRVGGKKTYDKRLQFNTADEPKTSPIQMRTIKTTEEPRINMHDDELNRVLGGGLVPGSLVLLGGEPGIGKSTLVLQTALGLKDKTVLYVSGEESARQIKLRADRITKEESGVLVVCEAMIENVFKHIETCNPDIVVIDSIQTMATQDIEAAPGSISQIRECAALLLKFAKETNIPVIIIGHITKEGTIAGPKILEHMVDTVLQFEGDQHYMYRIVRAIKNRFGSTAELGIYEMRQDGLRPVTNPSELLLSDVSNSEGLSAGSGKQCSIR